MMRGIVVVLMCTPEMHIMEKVTRKGNKKQEKLELGNPKREGK
jgi:hypothetical protein